MGVNCNFAGSELDLIEMEGRENRRKSVLDLVRE